jgi:hypothetical protein
MFTYSPLLTNPNMQDLFNLFEKQIMLDLNCHAVATVQSFDATKLTVQATVNYTKTYFMFNESTGNYDQKEMTYPTLQDVPVLVACGGAFSLTFPITAGDQALILFNDRDMDNWFTASAPSPASAVNTGRLHSLSDGLAIVFKRYPLAGYSTTHAILQQAGGAQVGVASKALITNAAAVSLGTALANLTAALNSLGSALSSAISSTGDTGFGTINSAGSALESAIATVSSQLSGLLE